MKRVVVILSILLVILALCLAGVFYAKDFKNQMENMVKEALIYCREGNLPGLIESEKKMSAFWESRQHILSFYVRHDEIEKMQIHLVSLKGHIKTVSLSNIEVCLLQIQFAADHIYDRELPNPDNIF